MRIGSRWKIDGTITRSECLRVPLSEPWVDKFHPFKSLYYVIKVSLMETENKDLLIEGAKTFGIYLDGGAVRAFDLYLKELFKWN